MTAITLEIPDYLAQTIHNMGDQLPLVLEMGLSRFAPLSTQAYREAITFLTQESPLEIITTFRFSNEIENRITELLAKNRTDQLSQAEAVELERLSQLEEQLQLVKASAFIKLNRV